MNERVRRLRQESVDARPHISSERARLVTDFYASGAPFRYSAPVLRARCLEHIMTHRTVYIGDGELIVGERGPAPKATPTYPELCCHSLSDLDIMSRRERTPFDVSAGVREVYETEIIPFWSGNTIRDRLFEAMEPEWLAAFEAGVFTEFMEQRAPGHAILDDKIYRRGFLDVKAEIAERREALDYDADPLAWDKDQQLQAIGVAIDALLIFATRHAEEARRLAASETEPGRRSELERIADVCHRVPAHAPRDFHEALQTYWFVHLAVITELNTWDSFNPGRLDQHLAPFYERGLADGSLTRESAEELLGCFWIKFNNQPAPPKVGITEEQSGTYTDFCLINMGGLDADGDDAVNDVTSLMLDVVGQMQLIQPSACVQISVKNPDEFVRQACEVIRTGLGQPSVFNTDVIIEEMLHDGKSTADALAGGPSGCVTISAFGKESCTLTGYYNWPKVLELALGDGVDPRTGRQVGPRTGDPRGIASFDDLYAAFVVQLRYFVDVKIAGNNRIERLFATRMPAPFMSAVMDDCIASATDYHAGGARYNTTYIQGVGLGTLTDSLAALKYHVFDLETLGMDELLDALADDFDDREPLRQLFVHKTPKYGNDDDYADDIAAAVFETYYDALNGRPNTKGGRYRVNLLPTTVHIYFGQVTGALPNGRHAGVALSEGISPTQGADTHGPTAVLKSAARIDHSRTGGTLLNLRLSPQVLEGDGVVRQSELIRSYFRLGGHHVQFNVVSPETLRAAQADPESHRDLIIRVAGYSDYFVDIGADLQNEIISRTEHGAL